MSVVHVLLVLVLGRRLIRRNTRFRAVSLGSNGSMDLSGIGWVGCIQIKGWIDGGVLSWSLAGVKPGASQ